MDTLRMFIAAAILGLTGCVSAARDDLPGAGHSRADIDFVHGCWVQKDAASGAIQAFLRLLPESDSLSGQITDVAAGDWITTTVISFARTGHTVSFDARDMPEQPPHIRIDPSRLGASFDWARAKHGGALAAFAGPQPSRTFLFAEGGDDRLSIWTVSANTNATLVYTLFDGERDGCD